jgi:ornithine racemase
MTAPRLEIDLAKIRHNARTLVERLGRRGIAVTGVTKATLGSPIIAEALLTAGVQKLGDSRIENIEAMRRAGNTGLDDAHPLADAQPGRTRRQGCRCEF